MEKTQTLPSRAEQNILESMTDGFYALDRNWQFTYINRSAECILGRAREDLIGKNFWREYPLVVDTELYLEYHRALAQNQTATIEFYYSAIECWYDIRLYPSLEGLSIYFRDITDRKMAKAECDRLLQREREARETAENANQIKDRFLAVLSHELRSPLNPILGWSQILRSSKKIDKAMLSKGLETIERNVKLQTQLIDDLLDISRILHGKLHLNPTLVNLTTTTAAAIETVYLAASAKSIEIQTFIEPNDYHVLGDEARLQQVVWNLLSNAVKFTPTQGKVTLCLQQIEGMAQIQVSDTGSGISPDFLPYVFEQFRQADGSITKKLGGLGLGLSIVRHLVELHGGTIGVESQGLGRGATFTVRLPLSKGLRPFAQSQTVPDSQKIDDAPSLSGLRILVVDDDLNTLEFMSFALERCGAIAVVASSAEEALSILPQQKFAILLSDIGMPKIDGYTLIRQVRSNLPERVRQIPAVALTAYAGDIDRKLAFEAGFQSHIAKPINFRELILLINKLTGCSDEVTTS